MKHDVDNRASALQITRVSYIVLKRHEFWSTNGLKLGPSFHPPSENSAFFFIARLCTHTSDHRTEPNHTIEGNKLPQKFLGLPFRKNLGPENFGPIFNDLQRNGNFEDQYLQRGTYCRQLGNGVGNYEGSPTPPQNSMNFGLQTA